MFQNCIECSILSKNLLQLRGNRGDEFVRFNILPKLLSTFGIVLLLLASVSIIAVTKLTSMENNVRSIHDDAMPSVIGLSTISSSLLQLDDIVLQSVVENDQSKLSVLQSQFETTLSNLRTSEKQYQATGLTGQELQLFNKFTTVENAYIASLQPIMDAAMKGEDQKAIPLIRNNRTQFQQTQVLLNQDVALNKQVADSETTDSLSQAASGRSVALTLSIVAFIIGLATAVLVSLGISRPLRKLTIVANQVSEGDLTGEPVVVKSKDETRELANAFRVMTANLTSLIRDVSKTAELVASSSEELMASAEQTMNATEEVTATIQEVATGSERQATTVEEVSSAMNDLSAGVQHIASNAQDVSVVAVNADGVATEGAKALSSINHQMEEIHTTFEHLNDVIAELDSRSQEIGEIVSVITGISSQTNLLALNAAIEAARAGESGRGFAVVADEVRKLAEQTSESAEKITQLIGSVQNGTSHAVSSMGSGTTKVKQGMEVVSKTVAHFANIQSAINQVAQQVQEVSAAVQQMSAGTEEVSSSLSEINQIASSSAAGTQTVASAAEEQLASMEEISSSATALAQIAEDLLASISQFKVSADSV